MSVNLAIFTVSQKHNWHVLHSPAIPCQGNQSSCGVAVFARVHIGLRWPSASACILVPHRIIHVLVDVPQWPSLSIFVGYFKCGVELDTENLSYLAAVGQAMRTVDFFLMAADWNLDPQILEDSGFPRQSGANLVVPNGHTCTTGTTFSTLAYFAVSPQVL